MNNVEPLILALIDAFILLEHSEPDEIDPDVAVRGMENMTASLDAADRRELAGALPTDCGRQLGRRRVQPVRATVAREPAPGMVGLIPAG